MPPKTRPGTRTRPPVRKRKPLKIGGFVRQEGEPAKRPRTRTGASTRHEEDDDDLMTAVAQAKEEAEAEAMKDEEFKTPKDAAIDGVTRQQKKEGGVTPTSAKSFSAISASSGAARSRPPCPPEPEPNSVSKRAWDMEKAVMQWYIDHGTHEDFKSKRKRELRSMKNRPKRQRTPIDPNASLAAFEKRLRETKKAEDFRCVDGVYLGEYQIVGLHEGWEKIPSGLRARALKVIADIAKDYGFFPKGMVSQKGTWVVDEDVEAPEGSDDSVVKFKVFDTEVPEGETRVYCGRKLVIQKDKQHPLAFLPKDEVPVGGKKRRRRDAAVALPSVSPKPAPHKKTGTTGAKKSKGVVNVTKTMGGIEAMPSMNFLSNTIPGVEFAVGLDDALTEDELGNE